MLEIEIEKELDIRQVDLCTELFRVERFSDNFQTFVRPNGSNAGARCFKAIHQKISNFSGSSSALEIKKPPLS